MAEKEAVVVNDRDNEEKRQMEFDSFTVGNAEGTIETSPEPKEDVEIEIKEEPEGEAAAPEGDAEIEVDPKVDSKPTQKQGEIKRPNKVPSSRRINQLTAEKYALAEEAARERAEVARLKRENEELNRAMMTHYEQNVTTRLDQAKQKLRDARNLGDMDAETAALAELSQAVNEQQNLQAWKTKTEREAPQNAQQQAQPQGQQQGAYSLNAGQRAAIQGWLAQNPWFDDTKGNEFDPDMKKDVQAYAASIESYLIKQGRVQDIATPQYFKLIDDYVKKNYPDDGDDSGPEMTAPTGGVTPASRSAPPATNSNATVRQTGGKTMVSLTAAERDMAHRMDLRHASGKSYSPSEKEYAYAMNKLKLAKK